MATIQELENEIAMLEEQNIELQFKIDRMQKSKIGFEDNMDSITQLKFKMFNIPDNYNNTSYGTYWKGQYFEKNKNFYKNNIQEICGEKIEKVQNILMEITDEIEELKINIEQNNQAIIDDYAEISWLESQDDEEEDDERNRY